MNRRCTTAPPSSLQRHVESSKNRRIRRHVCIKRSIQAGNVCLVGIYFGCLRLEKASLIVACIVPIEELGTPRVRYSGVALDVCLGIKESPCKAEPRR